MKKRLLKNSIKVDSKYFLGILFMGLFLVAEVSAQQVPQYKYEVDPRGVNHEGIPFFDRRINQREEFVSQWLYFSDDFGSVPAGKDIETVYFRVAKPDSRADYLEFSVSLKQDSRITTLDERAWETGMTQVRFDTRVTFNGIQDEWLKIELDTVYPYDPNLPLIVEVSFKDARGGMLMYGGGIPLNPNNARATTQIYGNFGRPTPNAGRTNSYSFGFDFAPVEIDAEIVSIENPIVVCADSQLVSVTIGNAGTEQIDSVEVHWEVDGVAQTPVHYTQVLDTLGGTGSMTASVALGYYDFQGQVAELKVYVANPNGGDNDENYTNDTLVINIGPGLEGIYTIDPSLPDSANNFSSITKATNVLNAYGVCGPVVFNIAAGEYNERLHLTDIRGASAINTITFDGGDSSQTTISIDGTIATDYTTIALEGTKYATFRNLGINSEGFGQGGTVVFANGAMYNTIENCYVRMNSLRSGIAHRNIFFSEEIDDYKSSSEYIQYNTIQNNLIIGGYTAIKAYGHYAYVDRNKGLVINNNVIDSVIIAGIQINNHDSAEIIGNYINGINSITNSTSTNGVYLSKVSNFKLNGNHIIGTRYGINIQNAYEVSNPPAHTIGVSEIINNMISSQRNNTVRLSYVGEIKFLHNSIHGMGALASITSRDAVTIQDNANFFPSRIDMRNNIISSHTGRALFANATITASNFTNFDNNLFYTTGAQLVGFTNVVYNDLADFQAAVPTFNQNSISADPEFVSSTDLHIDGTNVFQMGDNTVGVAVDIDGDSRPLLGLDSVSIGADEFYPVLPCGMTFDLGVANVSYYSADIFWTDTVGTQDYEYILVPCDSAFDANLAVATTLDSLTIDSLESNTCYSFYVRSICSSTEASFWSGPVSFSTLEVPYYAVGEINTSDANGVADSLDVYAWTSGTVVGINLDDANGYRFTIIDMESGVQEGIQVYSSIEIDSYSVEEGDSLKVKGTVQQNFGMNEFHIDALELISSGNAIPTADVVNTLNESTESKLVQLENFVVLDSAASGSYEIVAVNAGDTITIRIDELTEVSDSLVNKLGIGDTLCSIVGIGGQYDTSTTAPYLSGYYVIPMYYGDIEICKSTVGIKKNAISAEVVSFYPNPTTGNFTIEASGLTNNNILVTIYDISGRVILSENISNSNNSFKKEVNLEGQAKGIYLIDIIDGNNRIVEKLILK